jgi:hypothetical protein
MNEGACLFTDTIEGIGMIGFKAMSDIYFTIFDLCDFSVFNE